MSQQYLQYYIDISGTCNLACPSCPVGNFNENDFIGNMRSKGFMSFELFQAILDKIEQENTNQFPIVICLYNWGEPLLHPKLLQIINCIKEKGFYSDVSSNFNIKDIKPIVQSAPNKLIISISAYQQSLYQQTHRKGKIDLLLSNLYKLRDYLDQLNKKILVEIFYHLYQDNIGQDLDKIKSLCYELGFNFFADIALFMPLEKNLSYIKQHQISKADQALVDKLLIKPNELAALAKPYKQQECSQQNIISIRFDGSVSLCFPTYDRYYTIADSFLSMTQTEILKLKKTHAFCNVCQAHALHAVVNFRARAELNFLIDQRLSLSGSQFRMSHLKQRQFFDVSKH